MKGVIVLLCLAFAFADAAHLIGMNSPTIIQDQYIVVFHKESTREIRDQHVEQLKTRLTGEEAVLAVYHIGDFIGYSAKLSKDNLAIELAHENVRYIEADQMATAIQNEQDNEVTQQGATWGLDRIDERNLNLNGEYHYFQSSGKGVTAYIIDTGVLATHVDFRDEETGASRVILSKSFIAGEETDGNGHGTHVASTTAGTTWGVAKRAHIVAVKVLSNAGSGAWTGVISGIQFATEDHTSNKRTSVANMSLGGGFMQSVNDAVTASVKAGVNHVVAAGNNGGNACSYSPASTPEAITVGATTNADLRASFSNYGTCTNVFAPGNAITAAWIGTSNAATNTISGTSMASPHVCGAVAVRLGHILHQDQPRPEPADVLKWVVDNATPGKITVPSGPSGLLYSPFKADPVF